MPASPAVQVHWKPGSRWHSCPGDAQGLSRRSVQEEMSRPPGMHCAHAEISVPAGQTSWVPSALHGGAATCPVVRSQQVCCTWVQASAGQVVSNVNPGLHESGGHERTPIAGFWVKQLDTQPWGSPGRLTQMVGVGGWSWPSPASPPAAGDVQPSAEAASATIQRPFGGIRRSNGETPISSRSGLRIPTAPGGNLPRQIRAIPRRSADRSSLAKLLPGSKYSSNTNSCAH